MYNIGIPMELPTPLDPPPCWNRMPMAEGQWRRNGERHRYQYAGLGKIALVVRPVFRWQWSAFEDRCATHDGQGIGPNGESYPEAHGWMPWCRLCRWFETSSAVRS